MTALLAFRREVRRSAAAIAERLRAMTETGNIGVVAVDDGDELASVKIGRASCRERV